MVSRLLSYHSRWRASLKIGQGNTACRKRTALMPMGLWTVSGFGDLQHRGAPSLGTSVWVTSRQEKVCAWSAAEIDDVITDSAPNLVKRCIEQRAIAAGKIAWA